MNDIVVVVVVVVGWQTRGGQSRNKLDHGETTIIKLFFLLHLSLSLSLPRSRRSINYWIACQCLLRDLLLIDEATAALSTKIRKEVWDKKKRMRIRRKSRSEWII